MRPKSTDSIENLRNSPYILFHTISGSRAYGLETEKSDIDIRGIFILPQEEFFSLNYTDIVADSKNDTVYFELKKVVRLMLKNNPTMLELLASPTDCIRIQHPLMKLLKPDLFLSKLCENTFAGYAMEQIRKAKGLNKKILNPFPRGRKGILDFCYVTTGVISIPIKDWFIETGLDHHRCGLRSLDNMTNYYALFIDPNGSSTFRGIIQDENSSDVSLSQIPKHLEPAGFLHFNKDGYSHYLKEYLEYWEWVEKRNDIRYSETIEHKKNYDAKNLMHTFRILDMASEIARYKEIRVRRENRDYYLNIRAGKFEYSDLVKIAEDKLETTKIEFQHSDLPDFPNKEKINEILVRIREEFYSLIKTSGYS